MSLDLHKTLSKEAESLLVSINRGQLDLPRIKGLLSRVEKLALPSKRPSLRNKYAHIK